MSPSRKTKAPAPGIVESTRDYERRLAQALPVVAADLDYKHEAMASGAFPFLRATFYHWALRFPDICRDLADTPVVLAVGDLHVENYGSWRDAEGRLIWGVNDLDEAYPLPYAQDIVRLAASALLAATGRVAAPSAKAVCTAILAGYGRNLKKGGEPLVLEEKNTRLRRAVYGAEREPGPFWEKFDRLPAWDKPPPGTVRLLRDALPPGAEDLRFLRRRAGLGSLGRPRVTALATLGGARVARETKPLLPSAWAWANGEKNAAILYAELLAGAVRIPDPFLFVRDDRVVRRLSPHCSRIELADLDRTGDREKLFDAMGRELANLHLGTRGARAAILRDLDQRPAGRFADAALRMAEVTVADWKAWKKRRA